MLHMMSHKYYYSHSFSDLNIMNMKMKKTILLLKLSSAMQMVRLPMEM